MDTLMAQHVVSYGQTVTGIEIQKLNATRVQIGQSIPLNNIPPGLTVIAHMNIEVSQ